MYKWCEWVRLPTCCESLVGVVIVVILRGAVYEVAWEILSKL